MLSLVFMGTVLDCAGEKGGILKVYFINDITTNSVNVSVSYRLILNNPQFQCDEYL